MLRSIGLIIIIFSLTFNVFSQNHNVINIEDCYYNLYKNWPTKNNDTLYSQIYDLKSKNLNSNYFPQLSLNAQATYQSDVIKINIPIPGFNFESPSKDQYKATIDLNQIIYDGGVTSIRKEIENDNLNINKQQINVELFSKKEQINYLFFNTLLLQESKNLLLELLNKLKNKELEIISAVNNGVLTESEDLTIKAEILKINQQVTECENNIIALKNMLSIYTGLKISDSAVYNCNEININLDSTILRPELQMFILNKQLLTSSQKLTKSISNPKFFGFGQVGYGKPGFNFLNNNFQSFYIVGAKISWSPWNWNSNKNEIKVIEIQKNIISNKTEEFKKAINIQLQSEISNINKLQKIIESDDELIKIREKISLSSSSKVNNGTIRSSEYISDITSENQAKTELKKHKIQLVYAKYNYMLIKGLL